MSQEARQIQISQWQRPATIIGNKRIIQSRKLAFVLFPSVPRQSNPEMAEQRNRFVASIADVILFIHAAPGSQTEKFAQQSLQERDRAFVISIKLLVWIALQKSEKKQKTTMMKMNAMPSTWSTGIEWTKPAPLSERYRTGTCSILRMRRTSMPTPHSSPESLND